MGQRKNGVQHNNLKKINAVVMGKNGVGKTALTVRLLTRRFIGEYDSSLESIYRHFFELEGDHVLIDIMDTAGKNTDEKLAPCSSFGNLFLLLFSITDRSSFKEVEKLGRYIRETKTRGEYTIVVVGTKRDLRDYRAVSEDEGHVITNKLGGTLYFEISSADGYEDIERLFRHSVKFHLKSRFFDTERNRRVMGLKKLREGLLLRTKSLYRSRGMTF